MRTLAVLVCLAACQVTHELDDLARTVQEVRARMHVRFAATQRVGVAIALSDLTRAHEEARLIAKLDEPEVLPEWQPYVDNVIAAARQIELTKDTVAAANMTALLGRRCAQCHVALRARIKFPKEPAPITDRKLATNMASHQWAASRMWEGLIGPSDDRWLEGARLLSGARWSIVAEGDVPPELGVADDVARVRLYASRAIAAKTQDDRATIYGELLGTCARCHHAIRDRLK